MEKQHLLAVDIGNSWYKALASHRGFISEYGLPNVIAPFNEDLYVEPYDEDDVMFEENLIVEVKSEAIADKREMYYIGRGAAKQRDLSLTTFNNQKEAEDRTYVLLFGLAAYHGVMQQMRLEGDLDVSIDQLAVSLPTTQYKQDKERFKQRLLGTHTVIFHKVPNQPDPKELVVKLQVKDVIVGAEGSCAFLGLTRNHETLEIIDEELINESRRGVIIGDLGGDSVDFVGIKNNKPVASIEGEVFGVNRFLDQVIQKVSKHELYSFDSRAELEEKLIAGQSEWYVEPFAGTKKDISKYVIPQLKSMAIKYLEQFDRVRYSSNEIKGAAKYIAVGGAAQLAKQQIREAAVKWAERGRPIDLTFPENMDKLNVYGLMVLAKMNQLKKVHENTDHLALARG